MLLSMKIPSQKVITVDNSTVYVLEENHIIKVYRPDNLFAFSNGDAVKYHQIGEINTNAKPSIAVKP